MNILFIADIVPYPPNTGIKIRTYNIIKQLSQNKKNNIYLLAFSHKILINNRQEMDRCINALQDLCKEVHVFDIPSDRNKLSYLCCLVKNIFQFTPYRVKRYFSKDCVKLINEIIKKDNIDLVHLDKTELYAYKPFFGNIPVTCTNHNVESELMKRRARYEINLMRKIFAYLQYIKTRHYERNTLKEAHGYITCSDIDRDFFQIRLDIRSPQATINNGVDVSYYSKSGLSEENYVLIIGAQNKESTANYDATLYFMREIWPLITEKDSELKLKIVGRNPDKTITELEKRFCNVTVHGFIQDERKVIEKAKSLLVPLRVGGGTRLKILTAMAMSKAIVSTTIGAEGIAYEDGKNILIADKPDLFAQHVLRLISDNDLRKNIGVNARALVESRYNWDKIGAKLLDFYEDIVINGK